MCIFVSLHEYSVRVHTGLAGHTGQQDREHNWSAAAAADQIRGRERAAALEAANTESARRQQRRRKRPELPCRSQRVSIDESTAIGTATATSARFRSDRSAASSEAAHAAYIYI